MTLEPKPERFGFEQPVHLLPLVQKGLASLPGGRIQLANYQEVRIRHFHQTLDKYLGRPEVEGT